MASAEYLVVAGGGGGGAAGGGGGGAGGYRTNAAYDFPLVVGSYTVTVGAGGAVDTQGNNSVFDTITSIGGGKGGTVATVGGNGGSGGGGGADNATNRAGGTATAGQGNNGGAQLQIGSPYPAAGGGGAGAVGQDATIAAFGGNGGVGLSSSITGAAVVRAGGGGGGIFNNSGATSGGTGGDGGGGNGGIQNTVNPTSGTANTGGGGGGAGNGGAPASGGSGIVILRYVTADLTATGGTITTDGSHTVHTFNSSGTFEVTAVAAAPVADFSMTPTSGTAPLSSVGTDLSTNTPTSWLWEKNDGSGWVNFAGTPTAQNPTEIFAAGTWSVRLTATNAAGSDTETKTDYITVTDSSDTHDGFTEDDLRRVKERVRDEEREYRSKRDRLRNVIERAFSPEAEPGPVAAEVQAIAAPFVERLESGTLRVDYVALERRNRAVMDELLGFQAALRAEFAARMALENDDEDVMILAAAWN